MVVVAVQKGDRTGQRREAFPDETEVLLPKGDQLAIVHPVKGVVDKVAGYNRQVRRFRADAFHRLRNQVRHMPAQTSGYGRGAGQMMSEMKVGNVGDLHSGVHGLIMIGYP